MDRHVHEVDTITDVDGARMKVGVDYDSVVIGQFRFDRLSCEGFARAFVAACWEAADNARLMAEEAAG